MALPQRDNSMFFLCEDKVCNLEFNAEEGKDEIIADFIAERDTYGHRIKTASGAPEGKRRF